MHKGNFYILDLPVYRLPEDQYNAERNAYVDRKMRQILLSTAPEHPATADNLSDRETSIRDFFFKQYGGIWRYNEIIGYLRLYFLGSQVRAEYWRVTAKRIVRSRRKCFTFWQWKLAPEAELPINGTSSEIYWVVIDYIKNCRTSLPGRYIDATPLITLGPHLDWYQLLHG
jgi:hypothetical protein